MVYRLVLRYGISSVGLNPASSSLTSGIASSLSSSRSSPSFTVVRGLPEVGGDEFFDRGIFSSFADISVADAAAFSSSDGGGEFEGGEFAASTARLTNRPFTRIRRSAKFLRQLYLIFLFHTRRARLALNFWIIAARSAGVYI